MTTLALLATAALGAWLAGYLAYCEASPFATCRRCDGTGHEPATGRRNRRDCRRCHGQRIRLRAGRHLLNHLRQLHKDGTR